MIDRTTLDLRLAEHTTTTARINDGDWRHHSAPKRRPGRAMLAAALVALAARLDPALPAPERHGRAIATA